MRPTFGTAAISICPLGKGEPSPLNGEDTTAEERSAAHDAPRAWTGCCFGRSPDLRVNAWPVLPAAGFATVVYSGFAIRLQLRGQSWIWPSCRWLHHIPYYPNDSLFGPKHVPDNRGWSSCKVEGTASTQVKPTIDACALKRASQWKSRLGKSFLAWSRG